MTFLAILALAFSAFCLVFTAHSYVLRNGKFDPPEIAMELIFAVGGLATLATAMKVLVA